MFRITNFPDRVKVGPYTFSISIEDEVRDSDGNRIYGQCRQVEQIVRLQRSYPCAGQAIDTVIHELLHAIWWTHRWPQKLKEEAAVTRIATGLTALLNDNPEVNNWLTRATKAARA